jgi:dihydroxy-acid dehydratase
LGSGSDAWKFWDERRAGTITSEEWLGIEGGIARSYGHCMTMGTASTMTAIAEAMGLTLPGASSIPAADANHIRMCAAAGRRIVDMVWEDLTPNRILTSAAVNNAVTVAMATGCSTNAVIHLIAMARRAGVALTLDDLDRIGRTTPVIANIRPSGTGYLMEDFYYAGGLPALMAQLGAKLDRSAITVTGKTLGEDLASAEVFNADVIRSLDNPVYHEGSLAVLTGNLAPDGCVIKPAACDPRFFRHEGPAIVCDSYPELKAVVDDETLDITPDHVLVLRNAGPQGGPGMPEWGMLPMPKALLKQGHRDMLRISDARMSGTSYGACVLHVAPEAYIGGPLAWLRTGDIVRIDIPARTIDMAVDDAELARRRAAWTPPEPKFGRGYGWIYARHVSQADSGCDFDFLEKSFGPAVGEPDIY